MLAICHDIRRPGDNQFPGSLKPAGAAKISERLEIRNLLFFPLLSTHK